jgi:pimeloyl-ACP methyl ester carboxylesterase
MLIAISYLKRRFGAQVLIVAFLLFGCVGCLSSHTVAKRVLQAPNQQLKEPKLFKQLTAILATNFTFQQVSVGPPPARLELMVLEPGSYGAKFNSTITRRQITHGGDQHAYNFSFFFQYSTNSPQSRQKTNNIRGTIFLLHGYGLNKATMMPWGFLFAEAGYRVVLVDLRGHGNSTGDRIYFGSVEKTDLVQCLDALEQRNLCEGPVGVLGISYGAVLALRWAAVDPRVQSVTAISPYSNPGTAVEQFLRTYVPQLPWWTDRKAAGEVTRSLAAECADLTTETAVRQIKNPILFVRGENDELCSKADLNHLEAVAPVGSEMKEVPIVNHLAVGLCVSQLGGTVTNWFRGHLAR